MSRFDRSHTISLWRSIIDVSLSCTVSDIFNTCTWNLDYGSLKIIGNGTVW